jgi:hypothetical protein
VGPGIRRGAPACVRSPLLSNPGTPDIVITADPDRRERWLDGVYRDESLVTRYRLTLGTIALWQFTRSSPARA